MNRIATNRDQISRTKITKRRSLQELEKIM